MYRVTATPQASAAPHPTSNRHRTFLTAHASPPLTSFPPPATPSPPASPQIKALCPDVTHVQLPPPPVASGLYSHAPLLPAPGPRPSPSLMAPVLLHLEELDLAGSGVLCPRLVLPVEKLQVGV